MPLCIVYSIPGISSGILHNPDQYKVATEGMNK